MITNEDKEVTGLLTPRDSYFNLDFVLPSGTFRVSRFSRFNYQFKIFNGQREIGTISRTTNSQFDLNWNDDLLNLTCLFDYSKKALRVFMGDKEVAILSTKRTWRGLNFGMSHDSDYESDQIILLTMTCAVFLHYMIAEDEMNYLL